MKWYSYSYSIELDKRVRVLPFGRSTSTSTKKPEKTLKLVSENVRKDEACSRRHIIYLRGFFLPFLFFNRPVVASVFDWDLEPFRLLSGLPYSLVPLSFFGPKAIGVA